MTGIQDNQNIFVIPGGKNFEKYIVIDKYKDKSIQMIISITEENDEKKAILEKQWANEENPLEKILEEISKKSNKTKYAKPIAKTLINFPDEKY